MTKKSVVHAVGDELDGYADEFPDIPGYRIERLIGTGGMASVYLAIQQSLERPVAIKVSNDPESPEYTERFLNEGRIIASLSHSNIVTVHDVGIANQHLYISMEYVEGGDLRHRIRRGITLDETLEIMEKIGGCLHVAHTKGVIHRDVKPANILFRSDGTPLLADFGIAKDFQRDSGLTMDGSVVGSPYYLSPEQARAQPLDGRADIYSLGVILYEMLTNKKPFVGDCAVDTVFKHLNDPIPELPVEAEDFQPVLQKMLAKDAQERFEDIPAMLHHLKQLRSNVDTSVMPRQNRPEQSSPGGSTKPPDVVVPVGFRDGVTQVVLPSPQGQRKGSLGAALALAGRVVAAGAKLLYRLIKLTAGLAIKLVSLLIKPLTKRRHNTPAQNHPNKITTSFEAVLPADFRETQVLSPQERPHLQPHGVQRKRKLGLAVALLVAGVGSLGLSALYYSRPYFGPESESKQVETATTSKIDAPTGAGSGSAETRSQNKQAAKTNASLARAPSNLTPPKASTGGSGRTTSAGSSGGSASLDNKSKAKAKAKAKTKTKSKSKASSARKAPPKKTTQRKAASKSKTRVAAAKPKPKSTSIRSLNQKNLDRYERLARTRIRQRRLSTPPRDSAIFYYDRMVGVSGVTTRTRAVASAIGNRYADLAEVDFERGEFLAASRTIKSGLRFDPSNKRLRRLEDETVKRSARGVFKQFKRSFSTKEPTPKQSSGARPDS